MLRSPRIHQSATIPAMETVDTVIHARWVVPVEPHDTILENHGVAIRGGRIVEVAASAALDERYRAESTRRLDDHLLIPGLINAHTHASMSLLRGMADDLPLMTWLTEHIWPAEQRWVSEHFVRDGSTLAMAEMLLGGVTCFNDMYFFPEVTAQTAHQIGMRAVLGMIVIDVPSAYGDGPEDYLEKGLAFHDAYKDDPLVRAIFAPHAPYTVSSRWLERIHTYSEELELPVHIHVHETAGEVQNSLRETGKRPLQHLDELGLISPMLLAVHATQMEEREMERLAGAGAHVIHCPESNLKLNSGFCPAARLMEHGINVALGTDGAAGNNDLDLIGEMRTAALLGKAVANNPAALPATTVLRMATLDGARALGLDDVAGSLEPGKFADLTAVSLAELDVQPVYNPVSQLVYAATRRHVTDVWVAGRPLVQERRLTTVDAVEAVAKADEWRRRITGEDAGRHTMKATEGGEA